MSLVELMIAVSILTVGIMGFISAFEYITKSIHVSRAKTLAVNLAQEKMENLKNIPYYKVQLTTDAVTNSNFTPNLRYDKINYPPETIDIGGISFIRAVAVSLSGVTDGFIDSTSYDYPDTGMKFITVYVMWRQLGKWRYIDLDNLYENPVVDPLNATVKGRVLSGGAAVPGAVVKVLENPDWNDYVGVDGSYTILAQQGSYTIRVTSSGYFDQTAMNVSMATGSLVMQSFALTKIATGSISGYAWINSGLVISQIAASTRTQLGGGDAVPVDVEYVELFNPTTFNINIGNNASGEKYVRLDYDIENNASASGPDVSDPTFDLQYVSTFVPAGSYYLIASTESFYINATLVRADARYAVENADYIKYNDAACLKISDAGTGVVIDKVGWDDNSGNGSAPCKEGSQIPDTNGGASCPDGLGRGNQLVRVSTPPYTTDDTYGRAYDSGSNKLDFIYPELMCPGVDLSAGGMFEHRPRTVADGTKPVVAGKPALDAGVMVDDLIGVSTTTHVKYYTSYGNQVPVATFTAVGVATGTWNVIVASVPYLAEIAGVVVAANANTVIPSAATVPAGDAHGLFLTSSTLEGFVAGTVDDNSGASLAGIQVRAAGITKTTNAQGLYIARVSSGIVNITANPNNLNPVYSQSVAFETVNSGDLTMRDFTLSQAGVLQGFITTDGNSILPNMTVSATRGGYEYGTGTSDSSGNFYLRNLSTGTYTVKPVLDPLETYSPSSITATVSSTVTVHIGTFTISGAYGTLSGNITYKGAKLTSGALILVSTKTLTATPPAIVASSSAAQAVIYAASSKADGRFEVEVRGSTDTTFNVSAYIPVLGAASVSVTTKTYSGITIQPKQAQTLNITAP